MLLHHNCQASAEASKVMECKDVCEYPTPLVDCSATREPQWQLLLGLWHARLHIQVLPTVHQVTQLFILLKPQQRGQSDPLVRVGGRNALCKRSEMLLLKREKPVVHSGMRSACSIIVLQLVRCPKECHIELGTGCQR